MRIERFPVTVILFAQLVTTILAPAYIRGTDPFGLLVAICSAAVGGALYVEVVTLKRKPRPAKGGFVSLQSARWVLIIGAGASIAASLGGQGSYAVQLGLEQQSPIVALLSPFTVWLLFGTALHIWLYRNKLITRAATLAVVGGAATLQFVLGFQQAILGQAVAFAATLAVLSVFARLIRFRSLVVMLLFVALLWPTIYEYRNALRQNVAGSSAYVGFDNPFDRLQMDEQMATVDRLVPKPDGLRAPTALTLIRTGLLPRAIDRNRPPVNTGTQLNQALGGTATSATSATMMGNVYIFGGLLGVAAMGAGLAVGMRTAMRRHSPWTWSWIGLIYLYGMSFNASYPDIVPRMLQAAVSMAVALLFVRVTSRRRA